MATTAMALRAPVQTGPFDLYAEIAGALGSSGTTLIDGDVLVVSSKYAAVSQGRMILEASVAASEPARALARRLGMRTGLAEAVIRESEDVMGGVAGFAMAVTGGILAPNAGIDSSNAGAGRIILYPDAAHELAEHVRRKAFLGLGVRVGVILSDSRLMPMRAGTCGVAVAFAGIEAVRDGRGRLDLRGRPLAVTKSAVADSIATMANHEMGEGSESTPIAIVRGSGVRLTSSRGEAGEAAVNAAECVYARGLRAGGSDAAELKVAARLLD